MENTFKFDAEIGRVLHLVINSIYTNKEIFLRELISNASDAINKRKLLSLSGGASFEEEPEIRVRIDRQNNALVIRDNGIGMNREDLIKNIGTIANSGTFKFIESLKSQGASTENMIGQFGVGFYSGFMVASHIEVKTKKADENEILLWKSEGKESFTIEEVPQENFNVGTQITLYIKEEDRSDFLDKFRIEHIIKTYSNHIAFPISLEHEEGIEDRVNEAKPLWTKEKSEITAEEYQDFYKTLSYSADAPFLTLHNKVEGTLEYTNLLFVPSKKPFDLYNPERKSSLKLYVKKVFITEENVKILPEYLRFVKGIIDSADLPLNISRETLQNSSVLTKIGKAITKKIISEFKSKLNANKEEYRKFWSEFGNVIKEGLCRPDEMKEQILEACLFYSSEKKDYITIEEYLSNLKPEQKNIYFLTADSIEDGMLSPALEVFAKQNIEVLILADTVDDFWLTVSSSYKEHMFKNIATEDAKTDELLSKSEAAKEETEEEKNIAEVFKNLLADRVKEVKISHKLLESPAVLVSSHNGMSIRMERYLMEQKQLHSVSLKTLEINANHPLVKSIFEKRETEEAKKMALNLLDLACISSGEPLRSNAEFSKRMFESLAKLS